MAKVTAKFVFELPFHIQIQRKRSNSPQLLKMKPEEILVYPPALNSPYFSKKSPWSPKPEHLCGKLNNRPMWNAKYIIIDVTRHFPTTPITAAQEKALLTTARKTLYKVLTLYRWRGKQLQISVTNIEQIDYRVRYFDTTGNRMFWGPEGAHARGETHLTLTLVSPRNKEWNVICQDLISGNTPEIYESLLLDARSVASQEPRRAVLDAATACEIYIKRFYKSRKKRESTLNSLKKNKPELLKEIERLKDANRFVKHEGLCQYKHDKGNIIPVDSSRAMEFIKAVEETIEYTSSLESK